jgi:hypothetical protein
MSNEITWESGDFSDPLKLPSRRVNVAIVADDWGTGEVTLQESLSKDSGYADAVDHSGNVVTRTADGPILSKEGFSFLRMAVTPGVTPPEGLKLLYQ